MVLCVFEVLIIDFVIFGFDFYFILIVLNSKDLKWIVDLYYVVMKEYGEIMDWDEIFVEGYCVFNFEVKVVVLIEVKIDLNVEDVVVYVCMVECMFYLFVFYLEYSGMYGDFELVVEVKNLLNEMKLFYGGGIEIKE